MEKKDGYQKAIRTSCQSTNWEKCCIETEKIEGRISGHAQALDRCKGVGLDAPAKPCPTQFLVDEKDAEYLKGLGVKLLNRIPK